ncbi:MAG TPA: nucleotidyltransferase domain-containing protein [Bryobacteraceae bacterium]|nr:nucleotidyltransferase domain-containing protein [Bryobacteraceae bacterium]
MTEQQIREQFFVTRDAAAMLAARTALVDSIVRERWSAMPDGAAIAAVGGYGRAELFPHSDIDLLILVPGAGGGKRDDRAQQEIKEPLSLLLRDLWDKGLRISQSVHTPQECNQIDNSNAELSVSLLDRRFLAGDETLFRRVHDPRPELGKDIARLTKERHAEFQHTIYHLEPNVKDTPGGLRDMQVLRWLAKLGAGDEQAPPDTAVLFEVRCFLHYLAGRDDNRFTFDRQDEIAKLIGAASPEELMRRYYRAVRNISRLANRRIDRFEAKGSSLLAQFRDKISRLSNSDFSVVRGEILFRSANAVENDPGIVMRLFEFVAMHGLPLAGDTLDRLERASGRFKEWAKNQSGLLAPIRRAMLLPHAAAALRMLHACQALEGIFPELRDMEALVIRDFYHRYTVDEHTLVAITNALSLRQKKGDTFADLAIETQDFDLLPIALLFHDVGKGTPDEPHVPVSVRIARPALFRAGISERAWDIVEFLIAAHLELSSAMSGRDLSDPEVIRSVAEKVGTVERLRLLTLLTWADISAVNPGALTPWRRQLLWKLYMLVNAELTRELTARIGSPEMAGSPELRAFLEGLPPRYLRIHSAEEMRQHLRLDAEAKEKGVAVSLVRSEVWNLNVVASDKPGLFAMIAAAISSFGLNILRAEAFSNARGRVIDTFAFADEQRTLDLNPDEVQQLVRTVIRAVRGEITMTQLLERRPRVKPDARVLADARVTYNNGASPSSTLIELLTQDRPGLLCDIASVISNSGANIEVVLVDTEAKKAIDVFYVTRAGVKLADGEAEELVGALTKVAVPV